MDFAFSYIFVYVATYLFVALFCVVLLLRLSSNIARDLEVYYFKVMLALLACYCILESVWAIGNFGFSPTLKAYGVPLSVFNHVMIIGMCYYWFCFMEAHLHSPIVDKIALRALTAIPLFIALFVTASTPWTDWVFYQDSSGEIGRGSLYILVLIISYSYAALATIRAIIAGIQSTSPAKRKELFTMASFIIPPAVVGLIDSFVPYMPIVAPAFFFSYLIIFTMLQETQISHDALTGLNNRRRADYYFEESLQQATERNPFYYMVVDADLFKEINDTYGHLEGDRALCTIAEALKDACGSKNIFIARWGGDEFVVMAFERDLGDPQEFIDHLRDCLLYECHQRQLPYKLNLSIGYARSTLPTHTKRQILEAADEMLYTEKRAHHTKQGRN